MSAESQVCEFGAGGVVCENGVVTGFGRLAVRTSPFEGEGEVQLEGIQLGDIVRFVHEDPERGSQHTDAVILSMAERTLDALHIAGRSRGTVVTSHYSDRGLTPTGADGEVKLWNSANHTQHLGVSVSPTPLSAERAAGIRDVMAGITAAQKKWDTGSTEPSLRDQALDAFVQLALGPSR